MSRTEELALERLGIVAASPKPERSMDQVLRDIVEDNRKGSQTTGPAPKVSLDGAGQVVTGNDGLGWRTAPRVDDWRPPGLAVMDAMMDVQDKLDRAQPATGACIMSEDDFAKRTIERVTRVGAAAAKLSIKELAAAAGAMQQPRTKGKPKPALPLRE